MARPPIREDLAAQTGYHSPQVDVEVRLNTNEAPTGPPAGFGAAAAAALATVSWHRYPDRSAVDLRAAIGAQFGLGPQVVFPANGSNEVLQTLLLTFAGPGRSTLVFEPTYALHAHLSRVTGSTVIRRDRDEGFALDVDAAVAAVHQERPAVTFLCSPNNPTGMVETKATVEALLAACEAVDGLLVVDEAYGEFAVWSAVELIDEDRSVVVAKTYSKTWAMAGARLGFLLGPAWLVEELFAVVLPYHLDSFKQKLGMVALGYQPEMRKRVASIVEERGRIVAKLAELGIEVWPSEANFVLFRAPNEGARNGTEAGTEVWERLVERSVLVRNTASWDRLEGCLRVTVGTNDENDRFLTAIADILRA